jgi:hypothetical protein
MYVYEVSVCLTCSSYIDVTYTSETVEHLSNGFNLGVIERVGTRIGVNVQAVDGALVSSVERRSGVGRIGNEAVNGVGHLVTKDRKLVHRQVGLVFSVDRFMADQTGRCYHVCCHAVADLNMRVRSQCGSHMQFGHGRCVRRG